MINTFYGLDALSSTGAMFAALLLGFFFGLVLERVGFGSSRRLSGVFYFTDMAVVKVMFTALITAILGLIALEYLNLIDISTQIYFMPTYYGAYIVAGLIFGVGFVMGGWCPGTAMVGMASGKGDAVVFLIGGVFGSILFNELFPIIKPLYTWGQSTQTAYGQEGLAFIYKTLGMSKSLFALLLTVIAVGMFWVVDQIDPSEEGSGDDDQHSKRNFISWLKPGFLVAALLIWLAPTPIMEYYADQKPALTSLQNLLTSVEQAQDHVDPEALAELLFRQEPLIKVVDIRSAAEYHRFHIRGALNVSMENLMDFAETNTASQMIVLYSNGMTHPAQARDALFRAGYTNLYILTDGITGFIDQCLKPVSLRNEPLPEEKASQIRAWQTWFYGQDAPSSQGEIVSIPDHLPGLIETDWLVENIKKSGLKIIDCRDQADYNKGHLPGAYATSPENFRGVVNGVGSMLNPMAELALKFSLLNIYPDDLVVIAYGGDRIRDATLIGLAFERMGHMNYAILNGGVDKWKLEQKPFVTDLPPEGKSEYPNSFVSDGFSVDYHKVMAFLNSKDKIIIDVRPPDYYSGTKSDEPRAGHMPGAVNRNFSMDIDKSAGYAVFSPAKELDSAYADLIEKKTFPSIVHCRTGHQASQTYFVLKHLLRYPKVYWYDGGWSEWSARMELPIEH